MNTEHSENKSLDFIPEVTDWTGAARGMFANRDNPPYNEETVVLFDDKDRNYAKPALRAETTYSFYDRSSLEEFARWRQMLQRWVERLPPAKQKDIAGRMRHKGHGSPAEEQRFNGAFFELFLHEFLNGAGGDTVIEPKIGPLTPDFGVTEAKPDGTQINYVVEAADLTIVNGTDLDANWNERRALDILDEIASPDFLLSVETAGTLATMPRKPDLQRPFEELVQTANYDAVWAEAELYGYFDHILPGTTFRHDGWSVTGRLIPASPEQRPRKGRFVRIGPVKIGSINDIGKARSRLYAKAKHYKDVHNLIIALRTDFRPERIGEALFGSIEYRIALSKDPTRARPLPRARNVQKRDGFWYNTKGPQNENVIGVAAFYNLHPSNVNQAAAVFYGNPYTDQPLPAWAQKVAHAEYNDGLVQIVDGVPPCAYVKDHVPSTDAAFRWE